MFAFVIWCIEEEIRWLQQSANHKTGFLLVSSNSFYVDALSFFYLLDDKH